MNNIGEKEESWKGGSEKREGGKSLDFRLRSLKAGARVDGARGGGSSG